MHSAAFQRAGATRSSTTGATTAWPTSSNRHSRPNTQGCEWSAPTHLRSATLTAAEDEAIVAKINAAGPDIVWVGLSTPKQEYWMSEHLKRIDAPVMIGVGAAFDFLAGLKPQAPVVMRRNGLEWLYRLVTEPRRLWRRYLYIVPRFIVLAGAQLLTARGRHREW